MTQKLLNWLDSEDCHIDQYAIQQVKDKIQQLEELEVPVAGVTDEELQIIARNFIKEKMMAVISENEAEALLRLEDQGDYTFKHYIDCYIAGYKAKLAVSGNKPLDKETLLKESESEYELIRQCQALGFDPTKPIDFAFGWRRCLHWLQGKNKLGGEKE